MINAEKNSELLKDIPHIPYLDLAIVFEVLISEEMETGENATILIHHNHTKLWNTSLEEIYIPNGTRYVLLSGTHLQKG